MSLKDFTMRMTQNKICKHSVRYSASSSDLKKMGVSGQSVHFYIPNDLLDDLPAKEIEIVVRYK